MHPVSRTLLLALLLTSCIGSDSVSPAVVTDTFGDGGTEGSAGTEVRPRLPVAGVGGPEGTAGDPGSAGSQGTGGTEACDWPPANCTTGALGCPCGSGDACDIGLTCGTVSACGLDMPACRVDDTACAGIICAAPPANYCTDDWLRSYEQYAICANGGCTYESSDRLCEFGCANDACNPDPCAGVTCDDPPQQPLCSAQHDILLEFTGAGYCRDGTCTYYQIEVDCLHGCANDSCNPDPCDGVVCDGPSDDYCTDGIAATYSSAGCKEGACEYVLDETVCSNGCEGTTCAAETCGGMSCDSPPGSACSRGRGEVIDYGLGTCLVSGVCQYEEFRTSCPHGCDSGRCLPDPCDSITCDPLPADYCSANLYLVTHSANVCSGGECIYGMSSDPCQFGCEDAACLPDPCPGGGCGCQEDFTESGSALIGALDTAASPGSMEVNLTFHDDDDVDTIHVELYTMIPHLNDRPWMRVEISTNATITTIQPSALTQLFAVGDQGTIAMIAQAGTSFAMTIKSPEAGMCGYWVRYEYWVWEEGLDPDMWPEGSLDDWVLP